MATSKSDRYALVSSLYGPGTTLGWYLMTVAIFASFGFHLSKRRADKITADMIAVLTFPTVAAAHLISQVYGHKNFGPNTSEETILQSTASIEAALVVVETFMATDVVLFLLAAWFMCVKRASLLALIGLFCFCADSYLYFSTPVRRSMEHNFVRLFIINFEAVFGAIMAILTICIMFAVGILILCFVVRHNTAQQSSLEQLRFDPSRDNQLRGTTDAIAVHQLNLRESDGALKSFTFISLIFLPLSFVASLFPLPFSAFQNLPLGFVPSLRTVISNFANGMIPNSGTSIRELDQSVALLAGATVLGFSLYGTADVYYRDWLKRTDLPVEERRELERLEPSLTAPIYRQTSNLW